MNSIPDALVKNLSNIDFRYLSQEFIGKLLELVKQKGVSEEDCLHAVNVWNMFKINAMGDYHDLYLKKDVLLLADQKFINVCLEHYELDLCHYLSNYGLSEAAMFKMASVELELISGIDMYLFVEKGMRGVYGGVNNLFQT